MTRLACKFSFIVALAIGGLAVAATPAHAQIFGRRAVYVTNYYGTPGYSSYYPEYTYPSNYYSSYYTPPYNYSSYYYTTPTYSSYYYTTPAYSSYYYTPAYYTPSYPATVGASYYYTPTYYYGR
jgi:hypothetical protein